MKEETLRKAAKIMARRAGLASGAKRKGDSETMRRLALRRWDAYRRRKKALGK